MDKLRSWYVFSYFSTNIESEKQKQMSFNFNLKVNWGDSALYFWAFISPKNACFSFYPVPILYYLTSLITSLHGLHLQLETIW